MDIHMEQYEPILFSSLRPNWRSIEIQIVVGSPFGLLPATYSLSSLTLSLSSSSGLQLGSTTMTTIWSLKEQFRGSCLSLRLSHPGSSVSTFSGNLLVDHISWWWARFWKVSWEPFSSGFLPCCALHFLSNWSWENQERIPGMMWWVFLKETIGIITFEDLLFERLFKMFNTKV